jgi:hypothetical protein
MLKRINVNQLTLGMHLKEFCCSRMEHPFWRSGFVLTDAKDMQAILTSSIKEVWIDCDKGLDVAAGQFAVSEAKSGVVRAWVTLCPVSALLAEQPWGEFRGH